MKLIKVLFGLCLIAAAVSCGENGDTENEAALIGSWLSTDIALRECENEDDNETRIVDCPHEDCIRYTFSIDTTGTRVFMKEVVLSTGSEFQTGTFSVGETRITFCTEVEGQQECRSSKYTADKATLVLLDEDTSIQCTKEIKFSKEAVEPDN